MADALQPYPLRFAQQSPRPAPQESAQWDPAVKGYATSPKSSEAAPGHPKAQVVEPTRGVPTQFGKFTDPPHEDWPSLEVMG